MTETKKEHRFAVPELFELNWRLWSFVIIILMAGAVLFLNPVTSEYQGLTDPFYSPTVLVIPLIALFRITCYAYRKDYYRNVFRHPLSCRADARGESDGRKYSGERTLFALNNYHRYFLYVGLIILPWFYWDSYQSMFWVGGYFQFGVGSFLIILNTITLTLWTVSCHAFRHLTGGNVECYSCTLAPNTRKKFYLGQSALNRFHEQFAFISLVIVIGVDIYIRALMAGFPINPVFQIPI